MEKKNKSSALQIILLLVAVALGVFVVWQAFGDMLPTLFKMLKDGNEEAMEAYLMEEGAWRGICAVILLAALQVISIVFPGIVIQIAGGVVYGWWKGFLMCYAGFLLGNMLVFTVARAMGGGAAEKIHMKQKDGWIVDKMKSTKPGFVVAFINLLPVLPNGILPYVAATSSIKWLDYLISIGVSCWIQILFNCAAGSFLIRGEYFFMILAFAVQIAILVFVLLKRKWIMSLMPGETVGEQMQKEEQDEAKHLTGSV